MSRLDAFVDWIFDTWPGRAVGVVLLPFALVGLALWAVLMPDFFEHTIRKATR